LAQGMCYAALGLGCEAAQLSLAPENRPSRVLQLAWSDLGPTWCHWHVDLAWT